MKTILIFAVIFVGCDSYQAERYVCNCSQLLAVKEFIGNHIKDSNNMNDEEMEDVIFQLQKTGIEINCPQKIMWIKHGSRNIDWSIEKLDSCKTVFDY